jgi:hypothetical protein
MSQKFVELRRLAAILEAEAAGHSVDGEEAHNLAEALVHKFPAMAQSMRLVSQRMKPSRQQSTGAAA